jgi:hypothetical protein
MKDTSLEIITASSDLGRKIHDSVKRYSRKRFSGPVGMYIVTLVPRSTISVK